MDNASTPPAPLMQSSLSSAIIAEQNGVQADPVAVLRANLGIDTLAQAVKELQSLARGQLLQPIGSAVPSVVPQQPLDLKRALLDLAGKIADAVSKASSAPQLDSFAETAKQMTLTNLSLFNQYIVKQLGLEMPTRHVTIERKQ